MAFMMALMVVGALAVVVNLNGEYFARHSEMSRMERIGLIVGAVLSWLIIWCFLTLLFVRVFGSGLVPR
jgi:hypothetical protein